MVSLYYGKPAGDLERSRDWSTDFLSEPLPYILGLTFGVLPYFQPAASRLWMMMMMIGREAFRLLSKKIVER